MFDLIGEKLVRRLSRRDLPWFDADGVDIAALATHLDQLPTARRQALALSLGRKQLAMLFEAAAGFAPRTLADIVPSELPPLLEVTHEGRNSLPAFTRFAKVFCRPDDAPEELWGYNRNAQLVSTTVGPGYFVAYVEQPGEVLIDYLRLPPRTIAGWPPMIGNDQRLSRFVYNGTQDVLRAVSQHVSIGRARRGGKLMDAWFVLCRVDQL
ncbi:MAG: hypothetical protein H6707_00415 [Deltaproteobacteria bacterium]|nr:hypothetical protein [Deltaproteobacteria bacterium]